MKEGQDPDGLWGGTVWAEERLTNDANDEAETRHWAQEDTER